LRFLRIIIIIKSIWEPESHKSTCGLLQGEEDETIIKSRASRS